jgi:hypothetical protein
VSADHDTPLPGVGLYTFGRDARDYGNPEAGPSVVITERGCELELCFAKRQGDSPLLEIRLLPDGAKKLAPKKVREFVPRIEDYLAVARAMLDWKFAEAREAAEVLRQAGRPGRGHSPDFFRMIAMEYENLVAEGEEAPVKALAQKHHVVISAASRWLDKARELGYLPKKEAKSHAR